MTSTRLPLLAKDLFVGLEKVTHLCTGGEAPWLHEFESVYSEFARLKSAGLAGRERVYEIGDECRERMGQLWGVEGKRVAFMPSAAEGMNWLARGLDWQEGDNVVTDNLEFPSVAYAWRDLVERGVEVRMVDHEDFRVDEEALLAQVDEHTRVLAVSQVSFYTGQNLDIRKLAAGLAGTKTLLAVDATHAAGVVDVPAGVTDLCVSSSYKWLLATHGTAPCYLSERAESVTRASSFGWHNLAVWPAQRAERAPTVDEKAMPMRLEPGNPAMIVVLFLHRALARLLDLGIERIQDHAWNLSERADAGLTELGLTVISPSERSARSGNTCFLAEDAAAVQQALAKEGILVWGEYGRVRISGHLYNDDADIDHILAVLGKLS
ncbi:MAG: aminotransferase class V-fold PLP-dependent enzyme [Gemmatimonadetes bacterium]|jgi:selenocysteine lyase/cysteine desulfurase|nr:aminotransferase class V-fold PLP-dependent enzyme [Gemmatimonadota bacterium]MBT5060368.1 aminotransferase class V-fold PLP-dependent enzyme [Gemmatimonadota bacterium]MBT5143772.1 aminotransferase class V-fold PLP-dependent enzyme [Gemmatimonadota bacterium]MBT5590539.1 aminotransferase class V-fold PLP-dependent enzyme [Gemmatimonadota bacterium]MBT5965590.1 aminotransferase class V-fold PLP-dependent enzyme [Gemmatimonadota bacterium]